MEGSGLNKLMANAFAEVEKMLIGKKVPINVRALHLVIIELLCGFTNDMKDQNEFVLFLKNIQRKCFNRTLGEKSCAKNSVDAVVHKS